MATSLTNPLPTIHPIFDPLIATLADPGDPASGRDGLSQVEVQIEVEDVMNSGSLRLIGELLNPYNLDTDTATAIIHKALQGALRPDNLTTILEFNLTQLTGIIKRYRLLV